ncbi:MAG TPA: TIGR03364 family FAD-dependent oxidoreductase [Pirellulales bacterium]|nr:TIGR03364 family FAD-dependent oxidoreductase [Pirellulales bacterium]
MTAHYDVAVVGAGIMGIAHAWMAARRRLRVLLLERSPVAQGASVRNFGMIWPIGQPAGELYSLALRSRDLWLELNSHRAASVEQCGSIHLAHQQDELAVQEEFVGSSSGLSGPAHDVRMLTAREVASRTALANPDGLLAGMFSPTELRVDPRSAVARAAAWLGESLGVECCFGTSVVAVEDRHIRASDGRCWRADRVIVASGSDLETLFPEVLRSAGLVLCKLQMLRTAAQPHVALSTPHLASGLTLKHYAAFRDCPSWQRLQTRINTQTPELSRFGIHLMASQSASGEVILGDSHEYGEEISPFDKAEIDELILREARKVFRLSDWTIGQRWHGIYARHPRLPVVEASPAAGTHVFVAAGGAGMTMSFGLAERAWQRWLGETA